MGHRRCVEWDAECRLRSLCSRVDPAFVSRETLLVRRHVVRGARVYEPRVFGIGGACGVCGVGGHHRVCSMPHHEESTVVRVFRIRGVICELPAF